MRDDCNTLERRKKFCLRQAALAFALFLIGSLFLLKIAQAGESYEVVEDALKIVNSGSAHSCILDAKPAYAVASYDQSAVMVSARGYVKKEDLDRCRTGGPMHVYSIPDRVGFLSDTNLSKKLFVSLDFVSTRPFLYLATVSHIGSSKNLVTLDGAYVSGKPISKLREHAFNTSGEAGTSIISPNGRYVAPDGVVSCTDDAFPGVWDIENDKKVILDDSSCSALFDLGKR